MPGSAREPIDYHGEAWLSMSSYEYDHSWEREGCPGCKHNADVAAEAVTAERARLRALVARYLSDYEITDAEDSECVLWGGTAEALTEALFALEGPDAR